MIELKAVNLGTSKVDTLIVPVCEDRKIHTNKTVAGLEESAKSFPEFKGKSGERITLYNPEGTQITRVVFLGLGKAEKFDAETFRYLQAKR
jgi:leucyl aminopeptidase